MKIIIETIPHATQKYPTVGNYWTDEDGTQHIVVSEMGNDDYAFLIALHELVEAKLCQKRGISNEAIDKFDMEFEDARVDGDTSEPGDDPSSCYVREHCFATGIERLMCAELGINWQDYETSVNGL